MHCRASAKPSARGSAPGTVLPTTSLLRCIWLSCWRSAGSPSATGSRSPCLMRCRRRWPSRPWLAWPCWRPRRGYMMSVVSAAWPSGRRRVPELPLPKMSPCAATAFIATYDIRFTARDFSCCGGSRGRRSAWRPPCAVRPIWSSVRRWRSASWLRSTVTTTGATATPCRRSCRGSGGYGAKVETESDAPA